MKRILLLLLGGLPLAVIAQTADPLNTAKRCSYMSADERDMIYEINRVRHEPQSYLVYLNPLLEAAKLKLNTYGKGGKNYSLTFSTINRDGKEIKTIDTTWHYINEEEVNALSTLVEKLKTMKPLSILQPDAGIYKAAVKHAADQHAHNWKLMHTGSDGSLPWDRILKYSPSMRFGNENIAGSTGPVTARDIVIQLLVDSGIPGYGHRENMLDPQWTHVACKGEKFTDGMNWWIQNFGVIKKNK